MREDPADKRKGGASPSPSEVEFSELIFKLISAGNFLSSLDLDKPVQFSKLLLQRGLVELLAQLDEVGPERLAALATKLTSIKTESHPLKLLSPQRIQQLSKDEVKVVELIQMLRKAVKASLMTADGGLPLKFKPYLEALIESGLETLDLVLAYGELGIPLAEQGRLEEAEKLLRRAIKLLKSHPDLIDARKGEVCMKINLGYVLFFAGRREEAELEIRTLLAKIKRLDPDQTGMVLTQLAFFKMIEGLPYQALSIMRSMEESGNLPSEPFTRRNAQIFQSILELSVGSPSRAKQILHSLLSESFGHMEEELRALLRIADWKLGLIDKKELLAEPIKLGGLEVFRRQLIGEESTS